MEEPTLSETLVQIEAYLAGDGAHPAAWCDDTKCFYGFIISQLQQWFRVTPAAQSFFCVPLIPHTAKFLLDNGPGEVEFPMIFECSFVGDPKNSLTLRALAGGYFDWTSVMIAKLVVQPDDCVVEVGANIGTETIPFATLVPDGRVIAIEADSRNGRWIEENLRLNDLGNVSLLIVPVSDGPERLAAAGYNANNTGLVYMTESADEGAEALSLDQIYHDKRDLLARVSYLHIDVEGFETRALRGAKELITNQRPIIYIEAQKKWLERAGSSISELFDTIRDFGYSAHRLNLRQGSLTEVTDGNISAAIDENWLAIPVCSDDPSLLNRIAETYRELSSQPAAFNQFFELSDAPASYTVAVQSDDTTAR